MAFNLKAVLSLRDDSKKGLDSAKSGLDGLKTAATAAGVAFATAMVFDATETAATLERVEKRLEAFAKEAGGAEAIMESFQKGVGGAVPELEAMSAASSLLQQGLVGSTTEMEKVAEIASRLGDQTVGVTDRVASFSQLLRNQSIMLLDNFGINAGKVRQRIAELQAATAGMSREQAFQIALFEQADVALGKLGPRTEDNLAKFERLRSGMADLKVEIGQGLLPVMLSLMDVAAGVLKVVSPLIAEFAELTGGIQRYEASIESLNAATSGWAAEAQAMVGEGAHMVNVVDDLAKRVNEADAAFHENKGIVGDLAVAYARSSKEAEVMEKAALDARKAIIAQSDGIEDANRRIQQWNETITNSHAEISTLTEIAYSSAKQQLEMAEAAEAGTQQLNELGLMLQELGGLEEGATLQTVAHNFALQEQARRAEAGATAFELHNQALHRSGAASGEAMAKAQELVAAREQANAIAEKAAREADMSAAAAQRQAAALQEQAAAADEAARAQGDLMQRMTGATEEMVKQQVFAAIDPAAIGIDAYAQLGQELGVLDEKAADLAAGVPALVQAYQDGIIPTENMAAATAAMYDAAGTAEFNVGALLDQYAKAPGLIDPSKEAQESLNEKLEATGEMGALAETAVSDYGAAAGVAKDKSQEFAAAIMEAQAGLEAITAKSWDVMVSYNVSGAAPPSPGETTSGTPVMKMGGVVPGPIGQPRAIIAHGGEIVSNPYQVGAVGGPGGPSVTNHFGGDTYVIENPLAAKMLMDQRYARRRARMEGRV